MAQAQLAFHPTQCGDQHRGGHVGDTLAGLAGQLFDAPLQLQRVLPQPVQQGSLDQRQAQAAPLPLFQAT
ncbi:hypothetical protein [Rhodanobacter lindaniclasticus]